MQTAHIMLSCPEVAQSGCVDALDELAVLVAAMIHDFRVSSTPGRLLLRVPSPWTSPLLAPCDVMVSVLVWCSTPVSPSSTSSTPMIPSLAPVRTRLHCQPPPPAPADTFKSRFSCRVWFADGLEHPLESYHVAEAFAVMNGDLDFTSTLMPGDRTRCVLATGSSWGQASFPRVTPECLCLGKHASPVLPPRAALDQISRSGDPLGAFHVSNKSL
jgi:hypothetical protein